MFTCYSAVDFLMSGVAKRCSVQSEYLFLVVTEIWPSASESKTSRKVWRWASRCKPLDFRRWGVSGEYLRTCSPPSRSSLRPHTFHPVSLKTSTPRPCKDVLASLMSHLFLFPSLPRVRRPSRRTVRSSDRAYMHYVSRCGMWPPIRIAQLAMEFFRTTGLKEARSALPSRNRLCSSWIFVTIRIGNNLTRNVMSFGECWAQMRRSQYPREIKENVDERWFMFVLTMHYGFR